MGAFEYKALDSRGKDKKGILEGDSSRQVRQQLREKGWMPLAVVEVLERPGKTDKSGTEKPKRFKGRISAMDLALITRQLSTLLRSGLPLENCLQTVARQSAKPNLERILLGVRSRVREGHSLANGMSEFPSIFSELYVRTIDAGEQSGHLDVVLDRLSDYTESRQQIRQKTVLALFYPALLTIVSILIVAALLVFVVPKIVAVFENSGQELPMLTNVLIGLSDFLRTQWIAIVVVLGLLYTAFKLLRNRPAFEAGWQRVQLGIPLIGKLIRTTNAAQFSRTLSILTASSVPILEALRISAQVLTNKPMRHAVEEASLRVREGSSLNKALEDTGYFPPMTISLMASGEASGNLEEMLERSSVIQEREVEALISTFVGLFEPILILVMGGIVLLIVIAILLPIFDLNQLVS